MRQSGIEAQKMQGINRAGNGSKQGTGEHEKWWEREQRQEVGVEQKKTLKHETMKNRTPLTT